MLKKRVVATLVVRDGIVVQSVAFQRYLPVGRPHIAVEFLNQWGADEIVLLDISATAAGRGPDLNLVREMRVTRHFTLLLKNEAQFKFFLDILVMIKQRVFSWV